MREIAEFRAWDGLNKKFTYWTMNDLCNHTDSSEEKPSALEDWMQYTGIKDKNGKKIYSGDILEDKAVVEYFEYLGWEGGGSCHPGFFCKKWIEWMYDGLKGGDMSHMYRLDETVEVVGNVVENPELLNK